MCTTNEDILETSLVLQEVINQTEQLTGNELSDHYTKVEGLIACAKQNFDERYARRFTLDSPVEKYALLRTLAIGTFGSVVLAKEGANYYAAKLMEKQLVMRKKLRAQVHQEIRILDAMRFEFVVHLEDFVRTNCYVILVMPFVGGGEMFEYVRAHGKCDEAQVVLAFEYIHGVGVIYRDLKPENVMIDETGYIKLTDFGFSKKVDDERAWTLCGTPEYLAPEIIMNKGYDKSVDWWAFGIFVYEIAAGYTPFCSADPMQLFDRIVWGHFTFPEHFSEPLQSLLSNVIQVDRTRRYGLLKNGLQDIKCHAWFRTIDWNAILERTADPHYKPNVGSPDDLSNLSCQPMIPLRECSVEEFGEEFNVIGVTHYACWATMNKGSESVQKD